MEVKVVNDKWALYGNGNGREEEVSYGALQAKEEEEEKKKAVMVAAEDAI